VVLVAHGSRDPRAAAATEALARAVRRARPGWDVRASYLDHAGPRPLIPLRNGRQAAKDNRRAAYGGLWRKLSGGPGAYEGLWELVGRTYRAIERSAPPPISAQAIEDVNRLVADLKKQEYTL